MPLYRLPVVHRGDLPDREIQHWAEGDTVIIRLGAELTRREQDQQIVRIVRDYSRRNALPLVLGLPVTRQIDKAKDNPAAAGTALVAATVLVAAGMLAFNQTSTPGGPAGGHHFAAPRHTTEPYPAAPTPHPVPARRHPSPEPSASSTLPLERTVTVSHHTTSPRPAPTPPSPPHPPKPPRQPAPPPDQPSPSPQPACVTITLVIARTGLCL